MAGLAAERRSDEDVERMRAAIEAMDRGIGTAEDNIAGDLEFHQAVTAATGNRIARSMMEGEDVTITGLLLWLVARALVRHPEVNAWWEGDRPARIAEVNVGVAVAIEAGLVVPVVHGADRLGVIEVAQRRRDLVTRARGGALRPEDVRGGTFTLSNLGMFGVDAFTAIVNGPQAGVLAMGRVADRVIAVDGCPAVRPRMNLTLSCDHRVLDGAAGARFLGTVAELTEEPLRLLG